MPPEAMGAAPPGDVDFDLPCLKCSYNLRGLSGDPVRCPECGELNPVGDAEIPELLVAKRLRQMEAPLVTCVVAVLFAIPWQLMLLSMMPEALAGHYGPNATREILSCIGAPAFGPVVVWLPAVFLFRASCRGQPGWGRLLLRYHVFGGTIGALMLVIAILVIPIAWSPIGCGMRVWNFVVPALVYGGAIFGVKRYLVGPYQRLMDRIHALQHEVAIGDIRGEARLRLLEARDRMIR
jgi:hypothetical protein